MKNQVGTVDAVPSKRLFLSIISDYDLNRSICELIDNALDTWIKNGKTRPLLIQLELDKNQQAIRATDNAGGVRKEELCFIVGPGQTGNLPSEEIIGIFGVGTKRAVVALAQDIRIKTRFGNDKTYQIEFDDNWLKDETWELPYFEVDEINEGTTIVELQRLRNVIDNHALNSLREHMQTTYARFLKDHLVNIKLNGENIEPLEFEKWAYPPNFTPRRYSGFVHTEDDKAVKVEILAGLSCESSPASGEYGVYFYCNNRLIARALKDHNVGFTKGLAGQPHPSVSLVRVMVSINGPAQLMPWNSSKSSINPNHQVFVALRGLLVQVLKDYASLSRRFEGNWHESVFKYTSGQIVDVSIKNFRSVTTSYLPPLPKSRLRYADLMEQENKELAKQKPWVKGLYEGIVAVDSIFKTKLEQKNRICLILLDSTLEIAFKEYLVNESPYHYDDADLLRIFATRASVQKEIQKYIKFDTNMWAKIDYYYRLRCKLVHERATVGISDEELKGCRAVVEEALMKLFDLTIVW
jgi:hypothetical protein